MSLPELVLGFCREQGLISPGDHVICAVSGGADSVALLWCMVLLREKMNLRLSAAHFNHGLRGEESDGDEVFVRRLCDRLDVPLTVGRGNVTPSGRGLEDAARRARYDFFATLEPDAKIATAHTADDNAETLLLRQIRGSGLRGLGGIAPCRGRIIRPMLTVTRKEVEAFLTEWNLRHVEDSSNGTDSFLRNRIRHKVMPLLAAENPSFSQNASRMALELRQDEDYLIGQAKTELSRCSREGGLSCTLVQSLHPALRNRVLTMFLQRVGVPEPEAIHIRGCLQLLESESPSARLNFPGGITLERRYDILGRLEGCVPLLSAALPLPGRLELPGWEIICTETVFPAEISRDPYTFYISCGTMDGAELLLRSRQPGDRMYRPGGHKSLKKLMIDHRIPASLRDTIPLLTLREQIVFVPGIGARADMRPQPGTPVFQIKFAKTEKEVI